MRMQGACADITTPTPAISAYSYRLVAHDQVWPTPSHTHGGTLTHRRRLLPAAGMAGWPWPWRGDVNGAGRLRLCGPYKRGRLRARRRWGGPARSLRVLPNTPVPRPAPHAAMPASL